MENREVGEVLSQGIGKLMERASSLVEDAARSRPGWVGDIVSAQAEASIRRAELEEQGTHVPPFMIISVTKECNLNCAGCYARKLHSHGESEMNDEMLRFVLGQAENLGISIALIAGGEPLLRSDIIGLLSSFPRMLFPLFTNGLMLNRDRISKLREARNIVPVLSIEGFEEDTDSRRGEGVFRRIRKALPLLSEFNIFWGISVTVTRENFDLVTGKDFVGELIDHGCRLFFYVEYIAVDEGTENCEPTMDQRRRLVEFMDELGEAFPGLFITFPGDEEMLGGCLSSGRGFVHVNPSGDLEPCPFAPYSDTNLCSVPLKEALSSRLLAEIRENHQILEETTGGCALWKNREWVRGLMK